MLKAWIHRKLRPEQENSEDILTASVFGTLEHTGHLDLLKTFFSRAIDLHGHLLQLPPLSSSKFEYWPTFGEQGCTPCQPDCVLTFGHPDGSRTMLMVEAKFNAGKSSLADESPLPNDQLAKQWDNLSAHAKRLGGITPALIYLTADHGLPRSEIETSQQELKAKRGQSGAIYWISWSVLHTLLDGTNDPILADLCKVLKRCNLDRFTSWQDRSWTAIPSNSVKDWRPHDRAGLHKERAQEVGLELRALLDNTRDACLQIARYARQIEGCFLNAGFEWFEPSSKGNRGGQAVQIRDTLDAPRLWLPPLVYRVFRVRGHSEAVVFFTIQLGGYADGPPPPEPILVIGNLRWLGANGREKGKTKIIEELARFYFSEARPIDGTPQEVPTTSGKIRGPIRTRAKPVTMPLSEADSWVRELATNTSKM